MNDVSTLDAAHGRSETSDSTGRYEPRRLPTYFQLTLALVVLGLLARSIRYFLNFPLWGDEAFLAVNFLLRDFKGMIDPLVYGQIAPLGFMWVELAVTKTLGLSEMTMRLVPFLSGIATLLLFWRFASRNVGPAIAMLAVGFLAASYYPIRHAVEVKPYATDLLISLIVMMVGWGVYQHPKSVLRWAALVVFAGAAVWCSYPVIFMAAGVGVLIVALAVRRRSPGIFAGAIVYGAVLLASFGAMYVDYAKPHAEAASALKEIDMWTQTFPPLSEPWKLPIWFTVIHTGNMFAYPVGGKDFGSTATFLLVIVGCVALWRTQRAMMPRPSSESDGSSPRSNRALLWLLLSPLPFNFVAAAMHSYPYGGTARTSLFMAPAICLLAAIGVFALVGGLLPYPHRQRGLRIIGGVLCCVAVACMVIDITEPYKKPETAESRRAVNAMAEQVKEGDQVIVFLATEEVEHAPFIKEAKGMGAQLAFYLMQKMPVKLEDFGPRPEAVKPAEGKTWLVVFHRDRKGERVYEQPQLDAYLNALKAELGPHDEPQRFVLKEDKKEQQRIYFYCFGKSAG